MTNEETLALKSLTALYLELPESIAAHHQKIVTAAIAAAREEGRREGAAWVKIEDALPNIDTPVEVITEYFRNKSGKKVTLSDRFIGFMDERGDLIVCGTDDSYGWNFDDCVTLWRPLSPITSKRYTQCSNHGFLTFSGEDGVVYCSSCGGKIESLQKDKP